MNKYLLLGVLFFLLLFATYVVDLTDGYSTSSDPNQIVDSPEDSERVSVFSMISTFFDILTFKVEGLPAILNVLFFYPITIIIGAMVIDVLKDLVPFT